MMKPTGRTFEIAIELRRQAERDGINPLTLAAQVIERLEAPTVPLRAALAGDHEKALPLRRLGG